MSRFCVVSESPQIKVPPLTGPSAAKDGPVMRPPNAAAPTNVALDVRNSLRFMACSFWRNCSHFQVHFGVQHTQIRTTRFTQEIEDGRRPRRALSQAPCRD